MGICDANVDPTHIDDGKVDNSDLGKLCSSMPSPMARMYLGKTAFDEVNAIENSCSAKGMPETGHYGVPYTTDNGDLAFSVTPYHMIVNEILDLLEFIYKYGDSKDFTIKCWNLTVEKPKLNSTIHEGHKNLAQALDSAIQTGKTLGQNADISTIYLFYWKGNVIGGTTPFSLVYTSANLPELVNQGIFGGNLTGNNNNVLFSGKITPLADRDPNFRRFMYCIQPQIQAGTPLQPLAQYITDAKGYATPGNQEDQDTVANDPNYSAGLKALLFDRQDGNSVISVAGVTLMVSDHSVNINETTCDYIIKPTVKQASGAKLPLVLTKYGQPGLKYYKRPWQQGADVIPALLPENIYARTLPTLEAQYPFLVASDFLEEKIVEVGYTINNQLFETCCNENISYLLPLKRRFFDYFTTDNLASIMKITQEKNGDEVVEVTVALTIPLVNGNSIVLTRKYNVNPEAENRDVVDCYDGSNTFDLAIFPFYQFVPKPETKSTNDQADKSAEEKQNREAERKRAEEAAEQKNVYNVLLGATRANVNIQFYKGNANVTATPYTRESDSDCKSTHYHISKQSFNVVEVSIEDNGVQRCAIAVPKFHKISNDPTSIFSFSVDFGTTNTFVAYKQDQMEERAFSYEASELQVGTLHKDSVGTFAKFASMLPREFVPGRIAEAINSKPGEIKFPMRTSTYEISGDRTRLSLFSECCIGFNYEGDRSSLVAKQYRTNIKWGRDTLSSSRIGVFFHELIWMMKNKSVMNGGGSKFNLAITWPLSMGEDTLEDLKASVATAITESGCEVTPIWRTESEAPYYVNMHNGKIDFGHPYVNMDIGGGTTDILFYNRDSNSQFVLSAFFAANDLWNDGVQVLSGTKRNGILNYYLSSAKIDDSTKSKLNDIVKGSADSADVISYLFSDEDKWHLSDVIRNSDYIRMLPVIHFSALAYYLAYSLYMADEKAPEYISFTGMGSKYIQLINKNEGTIAALFNAMFKYCSKAFDAPDLSTDKIKVIFVDKPKEVTARGALITIGAEKSILINPTSELYYGYDDEPIAKLRGKNLNKDLRSKVVSFYKAFLDVFQDEEYNGIVLDKLHLDIDNEVISLLKGHAETSYDLCETKLNCKTNSNVLEPLFFWPLKDALCKLSELLCKKELQ